MSIFPPFMLRWSFFLLTNTDKYCIIYIEWKHRG
nr:MAG TPA: hypothetical protein [Caudoviricetes sp.]